MAYHDRNVYKDSDRVDIVKYISMAGMLGGVLLILLGIGIL
jgi:hypothetical protein